MFDLDVQATYAFIQNLQLQLNYNLSKNSQAVKKECGPQNGKDEIRCEIQGGSQEMAVIVD